MKIWLNTFARDLLAISLFCTFIFSNTCISEAYSISKNPALQLVFQGKCAEAWANLNSAENRNNPDYAFNIVTAIEFGLVPPINKDDFFSKYYLSLLVYSTTSNKFSVTDDEKGLQLYKRILRLMRYIDINNADLHNCFSNEKKPKQCLGVAQKYNLIMDYSSLIQDMQNPRPIWAGAYCAPGDSVWSAVPE
jgi:hypothetical protein